MANLRRIGVFAIVGAGLTLARATLGETTPVLVEVSVTAVALDEAALREAISLELDCPVVTSRNANHAGEILIKTLATGQVSVTFLPSDHRSPLRRLVALPQTPQHRVQLVAWLDGNMARNEAAEWLANHQREKQAEMDRGTVKSEATDANAAGTEPKKTASANDANKPFDVQEKLDLSAANAANNKNAKAQSNTTDPQKPQKFGDTGGNSSAAGSTALQYHSINIAVWHGLLELHPDAEHSRFGFHIGVGYGRAGAIKGFGFDLIHHRSDLEVQGAAGAFVWTRVGHTKGVAFSLGVVTAEQDLGGVDYAGLVAYRRGNVSGVQTAGLASWATGKVVGAQTGGVFAWSNADIVGTQAAFVFTRQAGDMRGLQMAIAANSAGNITGAQLGAVNLAEDVQGVQFGLVNIARNVDGIAIGLVNISDNVRTQALGWAERNYLENIGVRYLYSPLTFGLSSGYDSKNDRVRFLLGLGGRFTYRRIAFAPSLDLGFVIDDAKTAPVGRGHENDLRMSLEWELVPKVLGIMAGPSMALRSDSGKHLQFWPRWFAGLSLF